MNSAVHYIESVLLEYKCYLFIYLFIIKHNKRFRKSCDLSHDRLM